jgi:5-methylcytosine-specific restriction protein A
MEGGEEFDILPDEVSSDLWEGARRSIEVNAYERNLDARRACIAHHGSNCCVCGFDFGVTYGEQFSGFIHVHHLTPLSVIDARYKVDPQKHLVPVCANCHAIIHHGGETRSIEQVRKQLRRKMRIPLIVTGDSGGT